MSDKQAVSSEARDQVLAHVVEAVIRMVRDDVAQQTRQVRAGFGAVIVQRARAEVIEAAFQRAMPGDMSPIDQEIVRRVVPTLLADMRICVWPLTVYFH